MVYGLNLIEIFFSILACRSEGHCSVFSNSETNELPGCHSKALHRHVGGYVVVKEYIIFTYLLHLIIQLFFSYKAHGVLPGVRNGYIL